MLMKNMPEIVVAYAKFSKCMLYRYTLLKAWTPTYSDKDIALWIMLNPSTATADNDDPTVRKCQVLSKMLGYQGVCIANLFALRSTDPKGMRYNQPVGPDNDAWLRVLIQRHHGIFVAWGSHKHELIGERVATVCNIIMQKKPDADVRCLGVNKDGQPKHPLYLSHQQVTQPWNYWAGKGIMEGSHAGTDKRQGAGDNSVPQKR